MPTDTEPLEDALARCGRGDRQALKEIFDAEAGRLIGMTERILRRRDLAEEAVQEAFVRIWQKADQYAPDRGSARGWIYAIARNQALTMLRRAPREVALDPTEEAGAPSADDLNAMFESISAMDRRSQLVGCLMSLDEAKRRCVLMAHLYGFTHGEIAGRLSVPLGTAKAWVRRGLAALRECMA